LALEGIINMLKPPGMTSHDLVAFLRRTLGERKIGHCGTLDPQAAGVLPVCLGQATKLASYLAGGEKSYYGELELGYETDTQDVWGEKIAAFPTPALDPAGDMERVRQAARSLEGEILQETPAFSAVKQQGQSLHRLARAGKLAGGSNGPVREVFVRRFQILSCGGARIRFLVDCGSGTYVRMLCRDLARHLGSGGAMSFLLRLSVGPCLLADSVTLEELRRWQEEDGTLPAGVLAPKELALWGLPQTLAGEEEAARLRQGQKLWLAAPETFAARPDFSARPAFSAAGSEPCPARPDCPVAEADKACVLDRQGRLVALGAWQVGYGEKKGRILFRPDKTFN
jgi:tRNA pseudouridine55 synthase